MHAISTHTGNLLSIVCSLACRLLQQQQTALPAVLSLFLGPKGLGHPSTDVSTRACYLLSRLVKTLRANLRPYIDEMLRQLQPYLVVVATQPPPSGGQAVGECMVAVLMLAMSGV